MNKRLAKLGLVALASLTAVACGKVEINWKEVKQVAATETNIGTSTTVAAGKMDAFTAENPLKIGLVTDSGTLNDHSFNESAWKGVNQFAVKNGGGTIDATENVVKTGKIQTKYVQPSSDSYNTAGRVAAMKTVAEWGAKVIVLPGYLFQSAIKVAINDTAFKDVCLLALDCVKQDSDNNYAAYEYTDKVTSIIYREEQSGFLAGYAAVKEGFKKLGFLGGMAVPAVVRYGSGYCQGASYAAKELGYKAGDVSIQYYYAGEFGPTPAAEANCNTWYSTGTEVIFACGGAVYQSAIAASKNNGYKPWIGVDVNQHADTTLEEQIREKCITSAMKNLTNTIEIMLTSYVDNDKAWKAGYAGEVFTVGAQSDNTVLPTPEVDNDPGCWGFKKFTQAEYNTVLGKLKTNEIKVNANADNEELSTSNFGLDNVLINYIAA